jgi:hypothetical protein
MSARRRDLRHRFFHVQIASCHGADIDKEVF